MISEFIYKIVSLETDMVCVIFETTGNKEYIAYNRIKLEDGSPASYYNIDLKDLIVAYYENNQLTRIVAKKVRATDTYTSVPTISISKIQDLSLLNLYNETVKKSLSSVFGAFREIKPYDKELIKVFSSFLNPTFKGYMAR